MFLTAYSTDYTEGKGYLKIVISPMQPKTQQSAIGMHQAQTVLSEYFVDISIAST